MNFDILGPVSILDLHIDVKSIVAKHLSSDYKLVQF
jgi:hypothetical protein